jgi:hypothetical protein
LKVSVTYFGNCSEIFSKNINYSICEFEYTIFRNILENPEMLAFQLSDFGDGAAGLGRRSNRRG